MRELRTEIEIAAPPARPSRRARILAAAAAATVLSTATFGVAHADGIFSDVPSDHPFSWDIYWLAQTGVTTGYEDGTFRPLAPVSRQAMVTRGRRACGSSRAST